MAMRRLLLLLISLSPIISYSWECGSNWNNEGNLNFSGVVVGISPILEGNVAHGREIMFRIINQTSSDADDVQTVTTGLFGASSGYPFLCGSKYLVHATNTNGHTVTNTCYKIEVLDNSPGYDSLEKIVLVSSEGESKRELYLQSLSECHENK